MFFFGPVRRVEKLCYQFSNITLNRSKILIPKLKIAVKAFVLVILIANLVGWIYLSQRRVKFKEEVAFWKKVVSQNNRYPDGWAKLATLWYNLGEKELAKSAISKARKLDPVREEIRKLEEKINKN